MPSVDEKTEMCISGSLSGWKLEECSNELPYMCQIQRMHTTLFRDVYIELEKS